MNRIPLASAIVLLAVASGAASADEGAEWCRNYTEASGISDAPCACVVETAETDPALASELYSYATRDDYLAEASDELRALIGPCVEP